MIKNHLYEIVDTMTKAGYEVTIYPTQRANDAREKVEREAAEYDMVVCSGGDGTLDETVAGLMNCGKRIPLGYIPAGSTNDFATSLGIPKEMEKAAKVAVNGEPFSCDVGWFNGSNFVYVAAFGLFTEVSYKTSQEWKMCWAMLHIFWKELRVCMRFRHSVCRWNSTIVVSRMSLSMV